MNLLIQLRTETALLVIALVVVCFPLMLKALAVSRGSIPRRPITRRIAFVSFVVLASLLPAATALADQPAIQRFPVDLTLVDNVDCAFPVEIHIVGTDVQVVWTAQGDVHQFDSFAGGHAILTNLDTGETITVNIAGPLHFTFGEDGSFTLVGTGTSLFFLEETPGIDWVLGRWVFAIDAEGNSSFTTVGSTRDLCGDLAP